MLQEMHFTPNRGLSTFVGVLVFSLTLSALFSVGLVPNYLDGTVAERTDTEVLPNAEGKLALADVPQLGDEPMLQPVSVLEREARKLRNENSSSVLALDPFNPSQIIIKDVAIDVPVLNPSETSVKALDDALLRGVVRYPLSTRLNEEGNMFIFGHSSHLPVVKNKMFKAFNGIAALNEGDRIILRGKNSEGREEEHIYIVKSIRKADAKDEFINLSNRSGKRLTLSTCDSFGAKTSRIVVEAEFFSSYSVQ